MGFPGKLESSNVSRDNVSREIGRNPNGRLKTIIRCDDFWQLSNQAIVVLYVLGQIRSPDKKTD